LSSIQATEPDLSIFFAKCSRKTQDSTESDREFVSGTLNNSQSGKIFQQLCDRGFLSAEILTEMPAKKSDQGNLTLKKSEITRLQPKSKLMSGISKFSEFEAYLHDVLQYELLVGASILNEHHSRILGMFIATAYDLQRDMIITPKRLEYAKKKEEELFNAMMDSASRKQDEIKAEIRQTITSLTPKLVEEAAVMEFVGVELTDSDELVNSSDVSKCTYQLQDLLLRQLNKSLALKLMSSVRCLKESFLGTLQRCIESLESYDKEERSKEENSHAVSAFKQVCTNPFIYSWTVINC
jgi:receptor-interacting serine/threonine-protein kinase 5